jgi:hypothetical protein
MATSYFDRLSPGVQEAIEVPTHPKRHNDALANFLMENELGDQDTRNITQVNSHDDALEVRTPLNPFFTR